MSLARHHPAAIGRGPRCRGLLHARNEAARGTVALSLVAWLLASSAAALLSSAAAQGISASLVKAYPHSAVPYELVPLAAGLQLPVDAIPYGDDGALIVVSLDGNLWLFEDGAVREAPFLSLAGRVTGLLGEQGLFTATLEPEERATERGGPRHLVVAFTEERSNAVVVAAYPLLPDGSGADRQGEQVLLRVPVREPFHHGGQVLFGPDGMLYVSIGDGQRDALYLHEVPHVSQDLSSLRGKVLRIDPFPPGGAPYAVPDDNPFTAASDPAAAAAGARGEVWALGLRNPWKLTFAPSDGALIASDVGEDLWEEINVVRRGENYGWPMKEGEECSYFPDYGGLIAPKCGELDVTGPTAYYGHLRIDPNGGQSVTGGVEVTDPALPDLVGKYVFGDFVSGRLWSLDRATGAVEVLMETGRAISGIVADANGAVLVLAVDGRMARLVAAGGR